MRPTVISHIPPEVLKASSSDLDWRALLALSHTNTFFRSIYTQDEVWRAKFRTYFPHRTDITHDFMKSFLQHYSYCMKEVKWSGILLEYYSSEIKKDKNIVKTAVRQCAAAFQYADESLKLDQYFVMDVVYIRGIALVYADESLKKDRATVMVAVSRDGRALKFADSSLKKDRVIVMTAVSQNGMALEFADTSLKKDRDIVIAAAKQDSRAIHYADGSLRGDRRFLRTISHARSHTLDNGGGPLVHTDCRLDIRSCQII